MKKVLAAAWGAALASACGQASAQFAIGDGRRLDRNLQQGSAGVNMPTRDLNAEIRFRNAVVTGNAPNGLSLRSGVGYVAPGEFFGNLGSNNLFRYRRDTVTSGLAGLGIRGTDALQYQFALTTGNAPPPGLIGPGYVERSGAGAQGANLAARELPRPAQAPIAPLGEDDLRADRRGQELWTLRSPSAYMATRGLSPSLVAVAPGQDGRPYGVTASQLRGLSAAPLDFGRPPPQEPPRPAPPPGSARPIDLAANNLGANLSAEEPQDPSRKPEEPTDLARRASTPAGYEQLVARLSRALPEGPDDADQGRPAWEQRIEELRKQLEDSSRKQAGAAEDPADAEPGAEGPGGFSPETLRLLRDAGGPITSLSPEGVDAYATHMQRAEEFLKQGQYFFAEERFRAALSVRPNDPMAAIGRVHAQLGASLFSSAALNLRMLLISHPELVPTRYGHDVLPDAARIARILERLDAMVVAGKGVGRDTGLLIAYLGHQTSDTAAVQRGLALMEGGDGQADPQLQKLGALLRQIWTRSDEPEK